MYKFAKMNNEDRDFVFNNVAMKKGIHKALVEKDFWVCLVLAYLFTKLKFKNNITFKGGTSLSKGFNIIDRFSEDIDIILDWGLLGVKDDEPLADRSNTQQDKYNKILNEKAKAFIKDELLPDIKTGYRIYLALMQMFVLMKKTIKCSTSITLKCIKLERYYNLSDLK